MINNKLYLIFDIYYYWLEESSFGLSTIFSQIIYPMKFHFSLFYCVFVLLIKSIKAIELTIISYWKCYRWTIRFDFLIFCSEKANKLKCHVLLLGIVAQSAAMHTIASLLNPKNCIHVQSAIISTIHIMM